MTNDRTLPTRADAPKSQLTEEQLSIVSGGAVTPRDAASGPPVERPLELADHEPLPRIV